MHLIEKEHRDIDFFRNCMKVWKENKNKNMGVKDIVQLAILRPAESFYLSEGEIGRILRSRTYQFPASPIKREMYYEIIRRYKILKANFPSAKVEHIAKKIEEQSAPRFYISKGYAIRLYYSLTKNKKLIRNEYV